ncbi:SdrD B-like domain-containing protein, partial [Thiorhodococcus minor]
MTIAASYNASIAGRYFYDDKGNGVDDEGRAVAGAQIRLYDVTNQQFCGSTQTDADGNYAFNNLPAGDYRIYFSPNQTVDAFIAPNQGSDERIDNDVVTVNENGVGITDVISVGSGEQVQDVDAGLSAEPPGSGSIAGRYFWDENHNDLEDAGESGIQCVQVRLIDKSTNTVIGTTFTDANGDYRFDDVDAGQYQVRFNGDPTGKTFIAPDAGSDDSIDSDVTRSWTNNKGDVIGRTDTFDLAQGEDKTDVDAGVEEVVCDTGSISGRYFWDENHNDLEDAGESGIQGVRVRLIDKGTNTVIGTTFTDANGDYRFDDVDAGQYQVRFNGDPTGKTFIAPDAGSDDSIDSDVTRSWTNNKGDVIGRTDTFDLAQGEDKTDVDAGVE